LPVGEPWQDNVDDPEPPVMDEDDNVQTRFVELVVTARVTVLAKPLRGAIVIVEVPVAPELTFAVVGLAVTEKSAAAVTWKVTVAECERLPLVPATVAR